jgi:hypothetical protein
MTGEGLQEKNSEEYPAEKEDSNDDTIRTTKNRRSKSLDDLLNENNDDDMLMTQSMENILENSAKTASIDSLSPSSPVPSEKMCENEVITVDCSKELIDDSDCRDDSGIQCDSSKPQSDNSSFDEDAVSNSPSISSSTTSERKSGRALFSKYLKKVKNLGKK